MDKVTKQLLKNAREFLKNKKFQDALDSCKIVLESDANNYNAMVFVGVAAEGLTQSNQALNAYKKAIDIDSTQVLAWQGLCGFYEKSGEAQYHEDLIIVYQKLIELFEKDQKKKKDISLKLAQLLNKSGKNKEALDTINTVLSWIDDREEYFLIEESVLLLLEQYPNKDGELFNQMMKRYRSIIDFGRANNKDILKTWENYLELLLQLHDTFELKTHIDDLLSNYPNSATALKLNILFHLDNSLDEEISNLSDMIDRLVKLTSLDCIYVKLCQAWRMLQQSEYIASYQVLVEVCSNDETFPVAWLMLANARIKLHQIDGAQRAIEKATLSVQSKQSKWTGDTEKFLCQVDLIRMQCLLEANDDVSLNLCKDTCLKIIASNKNNRTALICLASTFLNLNQLEQADKIIAKLDTLPKLAEGAHLRGWHFYLQGKLQEAEESLTSANEHGNASYLTWYWLGRVHYSGKDSTQLANAHTDLIKAAQLDNNYSPTFLHLGHLYREANDSRKAQRCYQKSFDLNPGNTEAGAALVDCLVELNEGKLATLLLEKVTKAASAGSCKWAWLRLGLQQLKNQEYDASVMSFQCAIRADRDDVHVWECLGDAYLNRGSYSTALKAFTKALQLSPGTVYCQLQIGAIQHALSQYPDAVAQYEAILLKDPECVPAMKGFAETLLQQAKDALKEFLHQKCVSFCQKLILLLTKAGTLRPDLICIWKMLGDTLTILYTVPQEYARMKIPNKLLTRSKDKDDSFTDLYKTELLKLGGRCFGMGLKLQPDSAALLHDLAVNYYYQSELGGNSAADIAVKAIQVMQQALSLEPDNHQHWIALGVMVASDSINHLGLAQHCFIKAIEIERDQLRDNVTAWTNLGTLYLKKGDSALANKAFSKAQSSDPSYVECWIGQALIAEAIGDEGAMDLYRHTTTLNIHTEGSIGYAHWVCSTLRDKAPFDPSLVLYSIEKLAAIPAALDALVKYTDRIHDNPAAFNMLALLLERKRLYRPAATAMEKCISALASFKTSNQMNMARANFARILCQAEDYEEAIKHYKMLNQPLSIDGALGLALAHYKTNRFDDCLKGYQMALGLAENDADKSHIQAAIGMVHYRQRNINDAKTAFFSSFQMSAPSIAGLEALCALGLLEHDETLVTAVLNELRKMNENTCNTYADMAFLHAQLLDLKEDKPSARRELAKAVHRHPGNALTWRNLGLYMVQNESESCHVAARCAKVALFTDTSVSQETLTMLSLAGIGSGLRSKTEPDFSGFRQAQKAVHLQPDSLFTWCGLLSAVFAECMILMSQENGDRISEMKHEALGHQAMVLAAHAMAKVENELTHGTNTKKTVLRKLHVWCVQQYVIILLMLGRREQAKQFLSQAIWMYEEDTLLRSLSAFIDDNIHELRLLALSSHKVFLWQLLSASMLSQGLNVELKEVWTQAMMQASSHGEKSLAMLQLVHLAFRHIMADDPQSSKWKSFFLDACETAEVGKCTALHAVELMQALVYLHSSKDKLGRKCLQRAVHINSFKQNQGSNIASQARMHLFRLFSEKKDTNSIEALVESAKHAQDSTFLHFYEQN